MNVSKITLMFALLGLSLAACAGAPPSTLAGAAAPVADEGYYTDEYLTRSAEYLQTRDAWDAGYQQGHDAGLAAAAPVAAVAAAPTAATWGNPAGVANGQTAAANTPCANLQQNQTCGSLLTYSYGKDVPLVEALQRIVPKGWSVSVTPDFLPSKVTWDAGTGRPWPATARAVAEQAGGQLAINATLKTVAVADTQLDADKLCSGAQLWNVTPGTLKSNLLAWAKRAGWPLDWQAQANGQEVDYQIAHNATFIGQFTGSDGAVAQLLALYRHAEYPLAFAFKSNHVLVVTRFIPRASTVVGGSY